MLILSSQLSTSGGEVDIGVGESSDPLGLLVKQCIIAMMCNILPTW